MTSSRSFFILTAAAILLPNESFAQASPSHSSSVDEIQVIGSYASLLGKEAISPTDILSREDLDRLGATNFADVINTLTINRGAENNPDAFTQSATSGTSNINLRGLGVSSTLVLLNGRRTTQSAATTNTGVSFVDLNSLIPDIAVERIEILKDGASPLYGSDAVAGVVNFVTRKGFEGVDLQADYKAVDSEGDSQEVKLQALYGVQKDRFDLILAAGFSDVTELDTTERRLSVFGQ
ncbi:MAG: TonB-dependent receptor plug domain-containing protein, partial [Pseudomonadota bacterium]